MLCQKVTCSNCEGADCDGGCISDSEIPGAVFSDSETEDTVDAMFKRKRRAEYERKVFENLERLRKARVVEQEDGWEEPRRRPLRCQLRGQSHEQDWQDTLAAQDPWFDYDQMEAYEKSAVAVCEALRPGIASDARGQPITDEPARDEPHEDAIRQPEGETRQHGVGDGICCSVTSGAAARELALLTKVGGVDLNTVGKNEWISLPYDLVIDSGAAETVIPLSWLGSHPIEESPDSRAGAYYTAANGERIDNEGQRILTLATSEGVVRKMTFQVCNFEGSWERVEDL